jgi:hypothetical protein
VSNPMRFRHVDGDVEVEGRIGNAAGGARADRPEMTTVVTLPEDYRPAEQCEFTVTSETGPTIVRVLTNGDLQAEPSRD